MVDNIRLPVDIERGAKGGPGFKTTITTAENGRESRNQEWAVTRGQWDIGYGIQGLETLKLVRDFYVARRGRFRGFRFRDWSDYQAVLEPVGTTGNVLTRQLQRTYADTVNPYVRTILLPVADTLVVYRNNLLFEDYTLGSDGLLTFASDPGSNVKATFDYDLPVRFDRDDFDMTLQTYAAGSIPSIAIVELKVDS